MLEFDLPKGQSSIIKVIGVGGGGNNAVNHMYDLGIKGVDFINCNTDNQVLEASPVANTIHFGTLGTGAGNNPEKGRQLAEESADQIRTILEKNTQMVFITAGMGGGTGTGAAPVIAAIARSLDILTVAIVTEPFSLEGKRRLEQAKQGIRELKKYVDVLLVINNDKLREQYGDLKMTDAFHKADNVLANAAKGIAEIITVRGYMNVDLEDVKTVMKNSGTAIMGIGTAKGEDRATRVVEEALNSPLLNNIDIRGSKNLLLYITYGNDEVSMDEMSEIIDLVHERTGNGADLILGQGYDEKLGDHISISIVATGFGMPDRIEPVTEFPQYVKPKEKDTEKKIVYPLNDDIVISDNQVIPSVEVTIPQNNDIQVKEEHNITQEANEFSPFLKNQPAIEESPKSEINEIEEEKKESLFDFSSFTKEQLQKEQIFPQANPLPTSNSQTISTPVVSVNSVSPQPKQPLKVILADDDDDLDFHLSDRPNFTTNHQSESPVITPSNNGATIYPKQEISEDSGLGKNRIEKLRNFVMRSKSQSSLEDLEGQPAFRRKNVQFDPIAPSSISQVSNYTIFKDENGKPEFQHNSFLHDNVD